MDKKINIRNLTVDEIVTFCTKHSLPKIQSQSSLGMALEKRISSFEQMTSLSKDIRKLFADNFSILNIKIHKAERSFDKTIKYSFKLYDHLLIEGVLIPSKNRLTACISSQVGCSLACEFCATGTLKLERNISSSRNLRPDFYSK